jgi:hypothetical protein
MSLRSHDPLEGVRAFGLSSRAALGVGVQASGLL